MPCVCSPCPSAGTDTPAVAPAPPFPSSSRVPLPGAAEQSRKSPAAGPPAGLSFAAVKLTHSCAVPFLGVILFIFFIVVVIVIVFFVFLDFKNRTKMCFFFFQSHRIVGLQHTMVTVTKQLFSHRGFE